MPALYQMEYPEGVEPILERLRYLISGCDCGVTLVGNRLAVRFYQTIPGGDKELIDIHMIIDSVYIPSVDDKELTGG